jgi:hypothetical protein
VLTEKLIGKGSYIKKGEDSQRNNLVIQYNVLEKQEQDKLKSSRRREIIKIRAETHEIDTKGIIQRTNETKIGAYFGKNLGAS